MLIYVYVCKKCSAAVKVQNSKFSSRDETMCSYHETRNDREPQLTNINI